MLTVRGTDMGDPLTLYGYTRTTLNYLHSRKRRKLLNYITL